MAERSGISLASLKRFESTGKISLERLLLLAWTFGRLNDNKSGVFIEKEGIFSGLYGLFNDSLPDGWGLLLMDRAFRQLV